MSFCQSETAISESASPNRGLSVEECVNLKLDCTCYGKPQLDKIYKGLIDGQKCQVDLAEKDKYIKDRIVTWGGAQPILWYQEPSFIIGGMVVSASVASLVTFYLVQKTK